jgi:hypothetical protein
MGGLWVACGRQYGARLVSIWQRCGIEPVKPGLIADSPTTLGV